MNVSFAIDIDGVLVRSKSTIPGAKEALSKLQSNKIPFIFLTNGGGKTEEDHVGLISKRMELEFSEQQFVQSHTPFKDLVPELREKNILVFGGVGNSIRKVAHSYGFKRVFTPSDIYKTYPDIYPFIELTLEHHEEHGEPLPLAPDGSFQVSAMLVFSSPRDWGLDLQLMTDLMLSDRGMVHTISPTNGSKDLPNNGYGQDSPHIYWCNPDLTWATNSPNPRVAQGSFRAALQGIWKSQTGLDKLPKETLIGKPTEATYLYGERVLQEWNIQINGLRAPNIDTVYMIGDNPASDIQGANLFKSPNGLEWKSILVETGVYKAGDEPSFEPAHIVANVLDAVNLVVQDKEVSEDNNTAIGPSSSLSRSSAGQALQAPPPCKLRSPKGDGRRDDGRSRTSS